MKYEYPEIELLACPFCGGDAEAYHHSGSWGYYSGKWQCRCKKCSAAGVTYDDDKNYLNDIYGKIPLKNRNSYYEAKEAAVRAWNTRTSPQQRPDNQHALKALIFVVNSLQECAVPEKDRQYGEWYERAVKRREEAITTAHRAIDRLRSQL